MKIRFDTWEKENITIPIEDIDSIDSHDALTTVLYLKDGTFYRPFGKIKFTHEQNIQRQQEKQEMGQENL